MRICVLSNSHAASLKYALDEMTADELKGNNFTIFAAANQGLSRMKLSTDGLALEAQTKEIKDIISFVSGGHECIELRDYDVFFLHGLFLTPPRFDERDSKAVQKLAIQDMLEKALIRKLGEQLRSATSTPIWISPEPLRAYKAADLKDQPPIQPMAYSKICAQIEREFSVLEVNWLWQEPSTIGSKLNTISTYSKDSVRLGASSAELKHPASDTRHMNQAFGRIVLENLMSRL